MGIGILELAILGFVGLVGAGIIVGIVMLLASKNR